MSYDPLRSVAAPSGGMPRERDWITRILLTGASGFVGSHVLRHVLAKTDWVVTCPVTFRHRGNSDRIASALAGNDSWHQRVHVVLCDLAAPISKTTAARFGPVDEIWNVASDSHVDRSIEDAPRFVENNVALILNLLEYARQAKPRVFLQMSTDEVYGPAPAGSSHKEWDRIAPSNPYSASKACQESIAFSYWRTYGVPVIITNTMNIIGEMQDTEKMVPKTIRSLIRGEPAVVHVSPTGEPGSRFYLHARNLADAWLWISRNCQPQMHPDHDVPLRYHIVGEREMLNTELVNFIGNILGLEPQMKFMNFHQSRPGHDLRYALDGSKVANAGWVAPVPFDDSLRQTIRWSVQHPRWLGLRPEDMHGLQEAQATGAILPLEAGEGRTDGSLRGVHPSLACRAGQTPWRLLRQLRRPGQSRSDEAVSIMPGANEAGGRYGALVQGRPYHPPWLRLALRALGSSERRPGADRRARPGDVADAWPAASAGRNRTPQEHDQR